MLGQTVSYEPVDSGAVHSSSLPSSLGVGRDASHSSLPTSSLFLRLAPCGSSGEYFIGDTATIAAPHSLHLVAKPYSPQALQRCNLVRTILSSISVRLEESMKSMPRLFISEAFDGD